MSKKIYLSISGKLVFSIKVQDAPKRQNPFYGEVDIIFDIPKGELINGLFINKLRKERYSNVKYISWHGFYAYHNNKILNPAINVHHANGEKITYRHTGTINKSDEFAFPIASFIFNGDEIKGFKKRDCRKLKLEYTNSAVDIFILPKHLSFEEFLAKKTISIFFLMADMQIYDYTKSCKLELINMQTTQYYHEIIDGRTILFRERAFLISNEIKAVMPKGIFCTLHDPNSPLEAILDRGNVYDDDGQIAYNLRERYNQEKI